MLHEPALKFTKIDFDLQYRLYMVDLHRLLSIDSGCQDRFDIFQFRPSERISVGDMLSARVRGVRGVRVRRSFSAPWGVRTASSAPWGVKRSFRVPWWVERSLSVPWWVERSLNVPWGLKKSLRAPWDVTGGGQEINQGPLKVQEETCCFVRCQGAT